MSDDEEPAEGRMTFLEHLDELRKRITHAVVALLVGFLIAFAVRRTHLGVRVRTISPRKCLAES